MHFDNALAAAVRAYGAIDPLLDLGGERLKFLYPVMLRGEVAAELEVLILLGQTQTADFHQVRDHGYSIRQGNGAGKGLDP